MKIKIFEAEPHHREGFVAEFQVWHEGNAMDIPAEVYRDHGCLMIGIFSKEGGIQWEYPLGEFMEAVGAAMAMLDDTKPREQAYVVDEDGNLVPKPEMPPESGSGLGPPLNS